MLCVWRLNAFRKMANARAETILNFTFAPTGQFYECLNMASLYKLPCIFVVENNKWAIGMYHPRATGPSAGDDEPYIYKKGPAFGMPGVLVDGMDVRKVCCWRNSDVVSSAITLAWHWMS